MAVKAAPTMREPLVDDDGYLTPTALRFFDSLYRKTGQDSNTAPLDVTGTSVNITGTLAEENSSPNAQLTAISYATIDSIDAGGVSATIRVYGAGGVGTMWTRTINGVTDAKAPFPSATLPGFAYATWYDVFYSAKLGMFLVFSTATQYALSARDEYRYVGTVKTINAPGGGGGGGSTGGGGDDGSGGGSLLGGRLRGL